MIGNYVERREAAVPQSTTVSTPASPAGMSVSVPGAAAPSNVAAMVRVDQVQTQPSTVRPGDTVSLNATYTILSPSDQLITVRETREVRLNGELVANPAVDVARQTGTYSSALPITLPGSGRIRGNGVARYRGSAAGRGIWAAGWAGIGRATPWGF